MTIRVFIVDDHAVLRAGLRMLINAHKDMEVVGEAEDGAQAQARILETKPAVAVTDLTMSGISGIHLITRIRETCPETRVLVLTMHGEPGYLRAALGAGAAGYLVKNSADTDLITAIRVVAKGHAFIDRVFERNLLQEPTLPKRAVNHRDPMSVLSERELQVLVLVAQGHTNQQVADQLSVSVKTVETYRSRLIEKLELRTRAELVQFAMDTGLLSLPVQAKKL
ncbi:MAG: response regulator transcription factor [Deltaproteobacteria bacterium]|nr:response regulator transcription factor [Deltaproteobacteria bacterium]